MPRLFLIGGPSGVGKTTLAEHLRESMYDTVGPFAADDFFTEWRMSGTIHRFETIYRFNPKLLPEAHKQCQQNVEYAMLRVMKPDIIVTNTFTKEWERQPYYNLAKKHNYDVSLIMMEMPLEDDDTLAKRNTHGVDANTIHKMRQRIREGN